MIFSRYQAGGGNDMPTRQYRRKSLALDQRWLLTSHVAQAGYGYLGSDATQAFALLQFCLFIGLLHGNSPPRCPSA